MIMLQWTIYTDFIILKRNNGDAFNKHAVHGLKSVNKAPETVVSLGTETFSVFWNNGWSWSNVSIETTQMCCVLSNHTTLLLNSTSQLVAHYGSNSFLINSSCQCNQGMTKHIINHFYVAPFEGATLLAVTLLLQARSRVNDYWHVRNNNITVLTKEMIMKTLL